MRDVHGEGLLVTAERAEVRHLPVQADQTKQALHELGRLPPGHAEQHLHRQTGLHRSVTLDGLSPALPGRLRRQAMSGSNQIVSDPQRLSALWYSGQFMVL